MDSSDFVRSLSALWGSGYWVTWQPSVRHRLGDIGTTGGPGLVPITNLEETGIQAAATSPEALDDLVWRSESGVDVSFSASGSTSPALSAVADGQARAVVQFTGENGLLVAFNGLAETRLMNQPALAQEILRRYWEAPRSWDVDYCVVSHLVTAESGTVLAAGKGSSRVEIVAKAAASAGPVVLADLATNVRVDRSSGLAIELVGEKLTPFFRVLRLRKRFLRGIKAKFGARPEWREAAGRPPELPADLADEAMDDPDAVLEAAPQPGS